MRTCVTDLTETQWALVDSIIPEGKPGVVPDGREIGRFLKLHHLVSINGIHIYFKSSGSMPLLASD
jgi:hypothetical protein